MRINDLLIKRGKHRLYPYNGRENTEKQQKNPDDTHAYGHQTQQDNFRPVNTHQLPTDRGRLFECEPLIHYPVTAQYKPAKNIDPRNNQANKPQNNLYQHNQLGENYINVELF